MYNEQHWLWSDLAALEGPAQVISLNQTGDREQGPIETIQDLEDEVQPALELPVHGASRLFSADEETSSDEEPGSSVEDAMGNCRTSINVVCPGTITTPSSASPPESSSPFSPPPPERTPPGTPLARTASRSQDFSPSQSRFHGSLRSSRRTLSVVPEVKNCASGRSSNGGLCFGHVLPSCLRHCCIGPLFRFPMEQFST